MTLAKQIRGYFAGWDWTVTFYWFLIALFTAAFWSVVIGAFLLTIGGI